ncbi:MAG: hypothetical protein AAF548_06090 [Actinomycetota bacterium]
MPAFLETTRPLPDDDVIVVATRITTRNPITAVAILRSVGAMRRQLDHTAGLHRYGLRAQLLRLHFTTFAVFDDRSSMAAFLRSGAHGDAMRGLAARLGHIEARTASRRAADVPRDWPTIDAFLAGEPGTASQEAHAPPVAS